MPSVSGVIHTRRARTAFLRRRCTAAGSIAATRRVSQARSWARVWPVGVADRQPGQPHPHARVQFAGAISDLLGLGQIDPAFPQPGQHAGQLARTTAGPGPPGRRRHRWTSAGWWRSRPGPGRPAGRSGPATPAARRRPDPWPPVGGHAPRRSPSPTRQPPPPGRRQPAASPQPPPPPTPPYPPRYEGGTTKPSHPQNPGDNPGAASSWSLRRPAMHSFSSTAAPRPWWATGAQAGPPGRLQGGSSGRSATGPLRRNG